VGASSSATISTVAQVVLVASFGSVFLLVTVFILFQWRRNAHLANEADDPKQMYAAQLGISLANVRKCGKLRKYGNGYKRVRQPIKRLVYEHFSENLGDIDDLSKYLIKHSDGDKSNYNIDNLYLVRKQKFQGRKKKPDCSSKYIGVYWRPDVEKWNSRIKINGMTYTPGSFKHEENAGYVYVT
jgi:hypothetical protein